MNNKWLASYPPLVKLMFLLVLSIASLSVFLFFAALLVHSLWGFNFIDDPDALQNLADPFVVDANRFLLLFQHVGLFIAPALIFLGVSTFFPRRFILFKLPISPVKTFLVVFLLLSSMPLINVFIQWNENMVLPEFLGGIEAWFRSLEDAAQGLTEAIVRMDSFPEMIYMILLVAILPAIGEELMFRGVIQKLLAIQFRNYHLGIWGSAFLFSAMHLQFYGFLPRLLLGVLFGYMMVYTGSIIYPMIAHFFNNFASLMIAYAIQHEKIPAEIDTMGADLDLKYVLPALVLTLLFGYLLYGRRKTTILYDYPINPDDPEIADINEDYIGPNEP